MAQSSQQKASHSIVNDLVSIRDWGWDEKRLVQEIVKFRNQTMQELPKEFQPNEDELSQILVELPDTWRILATEPGRIDGFWHFVPLPDDQFQRAKDGFFHYGVLNRQDVMPLNEPGSFNILFLSLSVRECVRQPTLSMYLLNSYMDCMTRLAERGVFFEYTCCNLGTQFARRLNTSMVLGFEYIGPHQVAGFMYLNYIPDVWELPQYRLSPAKRVQNLRRLYAEEFKEIESGRKAK